MAPPRLPIGAEVDRVAREPRAVGSSEDPRSGGHGTPPDLAWIGPGFAAARPEARDRRRYGQIPLVEFSVELGLPIWRYASHGVTIERRVVLSHSQNTTVLVYRLLEGGPLRLELRP